MANVLDFGLEVSEFELQSCYCVHFLKVINLLISPAMGQIVSLLFFYKDGFNIK